MGIFSSINISGSGLTAQRMRMDVISNNIANVNTTRTDKGGVFRRHVVKFRTRNERYRWHSPFYPYPLREGPGEGVRVVGISEDKSPVRLVWDPSHPDAIKTGPKAGYVEYPNVNIVKEMTDMISASRAYEANVQMINSDKSIFRKILTIGR